jgi:hypothetical protein
MNYTTFGYRCPLCGANLACPFDDDQIRNNTEVIVRCVRGGEPAGCGELHAVRPSDGLPVAPLWRG